MDPSNVTIQIKSTEKIFHPILVLKKNIPTWVQHNSLKVIVLYPWTKICFLDKISGLISLSSIEQENFWDWRWSFFENVCQASSRFLIKRSKEKELRFSVIKVPVKWNFSPLFYSRELKSMLHWFIIFEFKLWSGAQNNFSIPPNLAKNAIVVFRGLELVTS